MSLLGKVFGRSSGSDTIGDQTCKLVLNFLESSGQHDLTASTFTELFAFVYFEIDSVLFGRKISARASIADSLSTSYSDTMQWRFGPHDEDKHLAMFDQRIQEYGAMLRSHKEKSDIVEKLDFYLNQASGLDDYHRDGESPVVIGDVFEMFGGRLGLTEFYTESLAPFIDSIIAKYQ